MNEHTGFKMKDLIAPTIVGTSGFLGTIEISKLNTWLGFAIGIITIASMLPIAIARWQKLLTNKYPETKSPFPQPENK